MKTILLTSLSAAALALTALGQSPTASPGSPLSTPGAAVPAAPDLTPVPTPAVTMSPKDADDLESRIEKKVRKGLHITIGDNDDDKGETRAERRRDRDGDREVHIRSNPDDTALMAIPIVGIIFTTLFGAPVLIVGVIMFFSYWKQRQLHLTVRRMVEKGQPIPEGLFSNAPTPLKQRSDMRRGVVLVMVGLGLMIFFAAVNDWEGGAWALGIIPFLIGCGYLLVWKMEGKKPGTDNPPPLP